MTQTACDHVDAVDGGALFSLTPERATSNKGCSDDRLQSHQRGMHTVKEMDMLTAKIDLLLKKIEDYSQDKASTQTLHALDACMTCEVYGNTGRSANDYPETQEEAMYLNNNNGFRPQGGQG